MERSGRRRSAVGVGVGALVAGLVAFSLLATHASADVCADENCGDEVYCIEGPDGKPVCQCEDGLLVFDEVDGTCVSEACAGKNCGDDAFCFDYADGTANCRCYDFSRFNEEDGTCSGGEPEVPAVCAGVECGDGMCFENEDRKPECWCKQGSRLDEVTKKCFVDMCSSYHTYCGEANCVLKDDNTAQCRCNEGFVFQ